MNTKDKQRRYTAEFEIQADILAYRRKGERKLAKALKLESEADLLIVQANDESKADHERNYLARQAGELREHAERLRRGHLLIQEDHIPRLIRTMAAFKTQTMPFLEDRAVTIQK